VPADTQPLKNRVIDLIKSGATVEEAMAKVKRHPKTYENWRKDPAFAQAVDHARALLSQKRAGIIKEVPDFPEFCERYLRQPLHWHQLQWYDLLEGREPRDLHPSETFIEGDPDRILVNTPPEHAKSTTLTVNYVTWRICKDPNVRIIIVSKGLMMARKFVTAIKFRLNHPAYKDLQLAFAPEGGWKATAESWTTDMIYVGAENRDSGEKDPTVQALGIGGQIYGARADLIIMDDCVDGKNAHEFEKQIDWIQREVDSRVASDGLMLLVGTRMAPRDLYSEVLLPERYPEGDCPWTVLTQPVVLEFSEDPANWQTLWPKSNQACKCRQFCNKGDLPPDDDGMYPKWDGQHMHRKRSRMDRRNWALVYMQQQILEDAVFPSAAVTAAIDGQRQPGPMVAGGLGHRPFGMEGLYVIAGLDPAMAENTAAVVMGVDRATKRRWVLDVFDRKHVTPTEMRSLIKRWTDRYGVNEWRIEKNAFQIMLTQDPEIRDFLATRGCLLREHFTGANKWDNDFGVASMEMLFGRVVKTQSEKGGISEKVEGGLIGLPSTKESEACKRLVEQLITWAPETKNKTDIVMALWFCEIRAREIVNTFLGATHLPNTFLGRRGRDARATVNLDVLYQEQQSGQIYAYN